jgi:short-subunit dehydrogenase
MRVFITGASSGLGEGLALHYAKPGAILGLCARREPLLAALGARITATGARAIPYPLDVTDTTAMKEAAEAFAAQAGGVDLVIAGAGIGIPPVTLAGKSSPIATLMRVNVVGVTNTLVPFVPILVRQGSGTLVALGSAAGFRGVPGSGAYCASKAAVMTFMDSLRMDLHGTGVHAMTLCPGFVRTPMTASLSGKMPFVLSCDEAVAQMARAIARRERTFTFPWQVRLVSRVIGYIPEGLLRRLAPAGDGVSR